ncbi:hypothetical protein [Actinoallomurus sp. NPDC052274]|uniref:hypothetical protein n=1 Tax=Actinoallomurus sp. NPDC052274 TaxID=3155420 RepID=UPI00341975D0
MAAFVKHLSQPVLIGEKPAGAYGLGHIPSQRLTMRRPGSSFEKEEADDEEDHSAKAEMLRMQW